MNELMTADDVAAAIRIPRSSVMAYARRGADPLPSLKVGRHVRFRRGDVEEWLDRQR
jgi:excisionase family DNA binding protein